MALYITAHALVRAQERIPGCKSEEQARVALSCPAVELAITEGCSLVKIGTGQHIVLARNRVVTVLPRDTHLGTLSIAATSKHYHPQGAY